MNVLKSCDLEAPFLRIFPRDSRDGVLMDPVRDCFQKNTAPCRISAGKGPGGTVAEPTAGIKATSGPAADPPDNRPTFAARSISSVAPREPTTFELIGASAVCAGQKNSLQLELESVDLRAMRTVPTRRSNTRTTRRFKITYSDVFISRVFRLQGRFRECDTNRVKSQEMFSRIFQFPLIIS